MFFAHAAGAGDVRVRVATPSDAGSIRAVCTAGWRDAYADTLPDAYVEANVRTFYGGDRVREAIEGASPAEEWLVASADGTARGACRGARPGKSVAEVFVCYVHPDEQGNGVGSALLSALTDRQRTRGAERQVVDAFAPHDPAIDFYRAKGFQPVDRFPAATVDGVDPGCETVRLARDL